MRLPRIGLGAPAVLCLVLSLAGAAPSDATARLTGDLPRRAQLGFSVSGVDGALVVREVAPGSPAAAAGLRAGDRLVSVQGREATPDFVGRDRLRRLDGGVRATLGVEREGGRREIAFVPQVLPLEDLAGVDTTYGVVETPDGARLRSVVTRPRGATGRLPAIFLTQWVSCDGIEPLDTDAWGQVLRGLVTRSAAVFIRVERASGGDSEGPGCHELDYDTEVAHYRHAFDRLTRDPGIDPEHIFVFGMSLGGTTAPLVAEAGRVAGVVVSGAGALTYYERMLAFDRIGFERGGAPADDIDALMRRSAEFHVEYLLRGRTPEEIAAERPHLAGHWQRLRGSGAGVHYGRPFAWHRQAAQKDFAATWSRLGVPVLVVYGGYDQFEPPHAHRAVVEAANRTHPGSARALELAGMNHFYRVFATPEAAAADEPGHDAPELAVQPILAWLKERSATR